ncbi:MAG: AAA family ATPase, partial [Candidatus Firestonebacteria bacterium]
MTDNMTGIEQQGKPQPQKVAERWLKIRGIKQPQKEQTASEDKINPSTPLLQEAYDLFAERQELRDQIVGSQRKLMEPKDKNQSAFGAISKEWDNLLSGRTPEKTLSLDAKRELIRDGRIGALISSTGTQSDIEVINMSQTRVGEVESKLDEIFSKQGAYSAFQRDLSHQVSIRRSTHEVSSLIRFGQEADLLALKLSRAAQVDKRPLTSVERRVIEENKTLKEEADRRAAELTQNPDVFDRLRTVELKGYKKQLDHDHFAETPSRIKYLSKIEGYWTEGKKVLLSGETGTGKTEIIKHASNKLFGVNPESVTGHQDMSIYELLGKTGFQVQVGDVFRPAPLIRAMTGRNGKGQPFLFDEIDRAPNQAVMGIKTILNARPGEKGIKVQTDTAGSFNVGTDYAVSATANIKSEKYQTATELDPAIVRVFDAPLEIDYMPPEEVYDLALASLIDKRGCIPLSEQDARTTLKDLCDAASWIQDVYQGRKVFTDTSKKAFLEARGKGSTGSIASLRKALLDPGRTIDTLKGWPAAQVRGESFENYLNDRIVEFINNRAYPEEDRYHLTNIFALKNFLKGVDTGKLSVPGLTQAILDSWNHGSNKNKQKQQSA